MENFGRLKNIFNTILAEGISEKNDSKKAVFKKYVKMLRENKILKTQFDTYTKIESMVEENEFKAKEKVTMLVSDLVREFTREAIVEANSELAKLVEGVELDDYKEKELHENISNIIFSKDVDTYVDSIFETVAYVKTNIIKEEVKGNGVPNELLATIAIDKFNETYAELDESMMKVVKTILEGDNESREGLFKEGVKDCISLINEKLKDADVTIKESLLAAKENLLDRTYNADTFENDIIKILNLKNDLKK